MSFIAPDFRGAAPPVITGYLVESSGIRHAHANFGSADNDNEMLNANSWRAAWKNYLNTFSGIDRTEYHVSRVQLGENQNQASVSMDLRLTAMAGEKMKDRREDQLVLTLVDRSRRIYFSSGLAIIPEPSSSLLALLAGGFLLCFRRRS